MSMTVCLVMRSVGMSWDWFNSIKSYRHVNLITIPTQPSCATQCVHSCMSGITVQFLSLTQFIFKMETTVHTHFNHGTNVYQTVGDKLYESIFTPCVGVCMMAKYCEALDVLSFFIYSLCEYTFSLCFATFWMFIL